MALIVSAATGNFSAGATWVGGVVPTVGDEARAANGHTITIDVDTTCDEVSNAGTGIFTLNDGVTLTANVTNKSTTTSRNCLQFTAASPATASIVGNVTGGTVTAAVGVVNTSTGTLNITGNITGGSNSSVAFGVNNTSTGTINVTGNVFGTTSRALNNDNLGTISLTGNTTGGNTGIASRNSSTGTFNVIGIAIGGTGLGGHGISNATTGAVNLKRAKGSAFGPGNTAGLAATFGAENVGLGIIQIEELEYGEYGMSPTSGTGIRLKKVSTNVAVFNYVDAGSAKTLVDATQGQMPAATDVRDGVSYASGALTGTCAVPAAGSVALGVPVDATTGTAVLTPAAIRSELSVELGRIDAAISSRLAPSGTLATVTNLTNAPASVTPTDIWTHATRTITGGTVDTLTNAPSVPSASTIASQVRTELSTELGRLDATVSSRLASASYTAPANSDITAIKAKTDALPSDPADQSLLEAAIAGVTAPSASTVATAVRTELTAELAKVSALNTDRLAQCSTVATTGSQLAAALS